MCLRRVFQINAPPPTPPPLLLLLLLWIFSQPAPVLKNNPPLTESRATLTHWESAELLFCCKQGPLMEDSMHMSSNSAVHLGVIWPDVETLWPCCDQTAKQVNVSYIHAIIQLRFTFPHSLNLAPRQVATTAHIFQQLPVCFTVSLFPAADNGTRCLNAGPWVVNLSFQTWSDSYLTPSCLSTRHDCLAFWTSV